MQSYRGPRHVSAPLLAYSFPYNTPVEQPAKREQTEYQRLNLTNLVCCHLLLNCNRNDVPACDLLLTKKEKEKRNRRKWDHKTIHLHTPPVALLLLIVGERLELHHRIFMMEAVGWRDAGGDDNNNDNADQNRIKNCEKQQVMTSNVLGFF